MASGQHSDYIIVLTTLPDRHAAFAMARHLLELRLAACVNVLSNCQSMYHWQEKIETAEEAPVLIKALRLHYPAIEAAIMAQHPYEIPEIIAVPVVAGSAAYLGWIADTSATSAG